MSEPSSPSTPPSPGASGSDGGGSCPPPPLAPACEGRPRKRHRLENGKVLCRFEGCCKEAHPTSVVKHERIHAGERPFKCTVPDCGADFKEWRALEYHRMFHDNNRPYVCTAKGCSARFVQSSDLKRHFESNHTERAHQRRKRKGERLYKFPRSSGYAPDRETVIQFCGEG
jgi:hypothetical protein